MKKCNAKMITTMGVLIAVEIVLSRFCSIQAWNIKIGFSFVPVAVAAILLGPLPAGIVAALSDFLGAILFPIGAYFPGFTLSAFLTGVIFGVCFGKKQTPVRVLLAVAAGQLVPSLLLNTLWISILYQSPFLPLLATRVLQCAVLGPVQFITILALAGVLGRYRKQVAL